MSNLKFQNKNKRMPDGLREMKGQEITFTSVTRHHSGRYQCIADNGYGKVR